MRWLRALLISLLISLLVGLAIGTWIRLQLEASPIYIGQLGQLRELCRPNDVCELEFRSRGYLPRADHSMSPRPARAFSALANTKKRSDKRLT